jgi:hypothetical protein
MLGEMSRGVPLAVLALSCAGAPRAIDAPHEPVLQVRLYAPLAMKADARRPEQAVILATDARGGSTLLPLPRRPPGRRDRLTLPALVAADVLGKDVSDDAFAAWPRGATDDPATAAAATTMLLANVTGVAVRADATVIGTIESDGTVGPVHDLAQHARVAIDHGKLRIGVPPGGRGELAAALVEPPLGGGGAVEVVEVADAADAYQLMTGHALPRAVAVDDSQMRLDDDTARALETRYREWQQRLAAPWTTIVQLEAAGRLPPMLHVLCVMAKHTAERAEHLARQHDIAAAYVAIQEAWEYASAAAATSELLARIQEGELDGARQQLADRVAHGAATEELYRELGRARPTTIGGYLALVAALESASDAWTHDQRAAQEMAAAGAHLESLRDVPVAELGGPTVARDATETVGLAVLLAACSTTAAARAREELALAPEDRVTYALGGGDAQRLAAALGEVARNGLAAFAGPPPEDADPGDRPGLALVAARFASDAGGLPRELRVTWGDGSLVWSLAALAAARYAIALEVDRAPAAMPPTGLDATLAAADRAARAHAHAAQVASGAIPLQAKLAYQRALALEHLGGAAVFDALVELRASSEASRLAVMFARN